MEGFWASHSMVYCPSQIVSFRNIRSVDAESIVSTPRVFIDEWRGELEIKEWPKWRLQGNNESTEVNTWSELPLFHRRGFRNHWFEALHCSITTEKMDPCILQYLKPLHSCFLVPYISMYRIKSISLMSSQDKTSSGICTIPFFVEWLPAAGSPGALKLWQSQC